MQTFTGKEYVEIAIANAMGFDNLKWNERIDLARDAWNDNCDGNLNAFDGAKEPILLHKALMAYEHTLTGVPTGYIMGLDATSSGLQAMAVMSGCLDTAMKCNLVNTGNRESAYQLISNLMNERLPEHEFTDTKLVKKPTMVHFYNSIAGPKQHLTTLQLEAFYQVLHGNFPGATDVMDSINGCWTNKDQFEYPMPDGHTVVIKNYKKITTKVTMFDVPFNYTYSEFGANNNHLHLPANVTHSVDGYIARELVRRCNFDVIVIHDCFYCSPNNMNELRWNYAVILAELSISNILQDILRGITGQKDLIYNKIGDGDVLAHEILHSEYAIC